MLFRASAIEGYDIKATDGEIGHVEDFLFDDASWTLRWLVADTGGWLSGRSVLLPLSALGRPDPETRTFSVRITKKQVEDSPGIAEHATVSRRMESELYSFYGWEPYWMGAPFGAPFVPPLYQTPDLVEAPRAMAGDKPDPDRNLRSARELAGYGIAAVDGDIGEVEDLLGDDEGWAVRYMLIDTGRWLPGRKVLVSPRWVRDISWSERRVRVDMRREEVEMSPEFDPAKVIDRSYEERLHHHYDVPGYWV